MAGTTTNYGFPYMTSTDSANAIGTGFQNLATALDSFISGSSAAGKVFYIIGDDSLSTPQTTTSTTFANKTDCQVTGTTGKSGVILVLCSFQGFSANAADSCLAKIQLSGASTSATNAVRMAGTTRDSGFIAQVFDTTGDSAITATLQIATTTNAVQATCSEANLQIIALG